MSTFIPLVFDDVRAAVDRPQPVLPEALELLVTQHLRMALESPRKIFCQALALGSRLGATCIAREQWQPQRVFQHARHVGHPATALGGLDQQVEVIERLGNVQ